MPKPGLERSDQVFEFDPELLPEEQAYVNRYLRYAEVLLQEPETSAATCGLTPGKIIELPRMRGSEAKKTDDEKAA